MTDVVVEDRNALDPTPGGGERVFRALLVNTLVSGVTSTFLWFALTRLRRVPDHRAMTGICAESLHDSHTQPLFIGTLGIMP